MSAPWLSIVGMTEQEPAPLASDAQVALETADVLIGPARLLDRIESDAEKHVWQPSVSAMIAQALVLRGRRVAIPASGDPNWFGIGATLARVLDPSEFVLYPAPSSFQLAAARLKWIFQDCVTVSLHARPADNLVPHILPGNRVLALTSDAETVREAGRLLTDRGAGASLCHVLENLGSADERHQTAPAHAVAGLEIGHFHVLGIACELAPEAALLPPLPGLPEEAFEHDGQITKRDVRAAALARLAPVPGQTLWDVGAGAGSVAIEWLRAAPRAQAIAIEQDQDRCARISGNARRLGVPHLQVINETAPQGLADLLDPDAIFVGGGVSLPGMLDLAWARLRPGGRLVANAVTLDARAACLSAQTQLGGDLTEVAISHFDTLGTYPVLRPALPVLIWSARKGAS